MAIVRSFLPISNPQATRLILGSMPGKASLDACEYYAHPRNAFWPIMAELLQFPSAATYRERTAALQQAGIALWDVLQSCTRQGSLDSAIEPDSMIPNDFQSFLATLPHLQTIYFNGGTAERLFRQQIFPQLDWKRSTPPPLRLVRLPSTSPAHATLSQKDKLHLWRVVVEPDSEKESPVRRRIPR